MFRWLPGLALLLLAGCASAFTLQIGPELMARPPPARFCTESGRSVSTYGSRVRSVETETGVRALPRAPSLFDAIEGASGPGRYHLVQPADDSDGVFVFAAGGAAYGAVVALGPLLFHGVACLGTGTCPDLADWEWALLAGGIGGGLTVGLVGAAFLELAEDTPDGESEAGRARPCDPPAPVAGP